MKILVRLPNWLGDMVMSTAFVKAVKEQYPDAEIDLIAKKGIDILLDYFPPHGQRYIFSKEEYKGISGAWRFGKKIASQKKYDLFFCLPDSISSATMGFAIGASKRVGYKKELRTILLTQAYNKKINQHRVEEYIDLLQQFSGKIIGHLLVSLDAGKIEKSNAIIINLNSEASSRRLPPEKAVSIINTVRKNTDLELILVGAIKEKEFVDAVFDKLEDKSNCRNIAGTTSLPELVQLFAAARLALTTDSGPAHLANALGTPTIVLFGAGNEQNTAPWNTNGRTIIRLGKLSCEPCMDNTCKRYGVPQCLLQLDDQIIAGQVVHSLKL